MKTRAKILIVDDDPDVLNAARIVLRQVFETVATESNPARLPSVLSQQAFDVILLDMNYTAGRLTGNEGLFWLKTILNARPGVEVIMITAYGDIQLAVEAMKNGARDFVVKPWDNEKLEATVQSALSHAQSSREIIRLKEKQSGYARAANQPDSPLVFRSNAMKEVVRTLERVAETEANILLLGENGTGKDLLAYYVHNHSLRKDHPLVKIDVGALSSTLFESELFGHVKGAFTDAHINRMGKMELASGGTLFLDEIGNLSMPLQSKLLSALQDRAITPVGTHQAIPIDIRLISATQSDIHNGVATGTFREDLLYRINTVTVTIPPLRERLDDIEPLAEHFVELYATKYRKTVKPMDQALIKHLQRHHWPGNVRELSHAIERAVILTERETLSPRDFSISADAPPALKLGSLSLDEIEKHAIVQSIRKHHGNLSHVARELGVGRTTLYRKMTKYGIVK